MSEPLYKVGDIVNIHPETVEFRMNSARIIELQIGDEYTIYRIHYKKNRTMWIRECQIKGKDKEYIPKEPTWDE